MNTIKSCTNCKTCFDIDQTDLNFYQKVDVPTPTLCPECRQQRRASFRNEMHLYKRKCDATGEEIISMYRPDTKAVVYKPSHWWSDTWDPISYSRDIDWNRPFFEQFANLQKVVPRLAMYGKNNENCNYTNHSVNSKDCYLSADVVGQNIYYSKWIINSNSIIDSYQLEKSTACYESMYTVNANNTKFIYLSDNSATADFLYNCKDVTNSLMCWNLHHKEYHIENKPYNKKEYKRMMQNYDTGSYANLEKYKARFQNLITEAPRRFAEHINCEDSTGDYLYNCKNVNHSYGVVDSWDSSYTYDSGHLKDSYDVYESAFDCELQIECHACNWGKCLFSCSVCYNCNDCFYSEMCHNSSDLFGCIGVRQKKFCILNKQYSKEEYLELKKRLINHMTTTGEYGEFFPKELSFFSYNESAAMEFSPMTKEQALAQGFVWFDNPASQTPPTLTDIPDHIKDCPNTITSETLACHSCRKLYRIIPQELNFYRKQHLPIPRQCFLCRYAQRIKNRNPYRLYTRPCSACQTNTPSTYAPQRMERVLCEKCYEKERY